MRIMKNTNFEKRIIEMIKDIEDEIEEIIYDLYLKKSKNLKKILFTLIT